MGSLRKSFIRCQNIIGLKTETNAIDWLNDVCNEFKTFFHDLNNHLTAGSISVYIRENCLLCITQIVVCIRFLERTCKAERSSGVGLQATRQIFLDRIGWCLTKLAESTEEFTVLENDVQTKFFNENTSNFVAAMDIALDQIAPLTMFCDASEKNCRNVSDRKTINIASFREVINTLIGHALSFANLAQPDDRSPLTTVCQSVLREYMAFERIASIDEQSISHHLDEQSQCQLNATRLENALYQLDGLVNESLLRLVYSVFVEMSSKPLDVLAELVECKQNEEVDDQIVRFDETADRLQQIGTFAAAFAPDQKAQIVIRSALASFESLEPVLIPAIVTPHSPQHSAILTQHWTEESAKLLSTVQRIIDSHAFCLCLCDYLSSTICQLQRQYERSRALVTIAHCSIFQDHLRHNWSDLESEDGAIVDIANNFKLMLNECRAAIDACAEANEWHRVIKRFRILLGVSKKLCAALKDCSSESKENVEFTVGHVTPPHSRLAQRLSFSRSDSLVALNGDEADAFFESFGIAPATKNSILYSQSPVRDRPRRSNGVGIVAPNTVLSTQRMTRKPSLRSRLFKRALPHLSAATDDASRATTLSLADDQSFDLQITNILEQLTDLSTTLSNGL